MAHTCSQCRPSREYHLVPAANIAVWDEDSPREFTHQRQARRVRVNFHYRHDARSWKRTTKAPRQFARHCR